MSTKGIKCAKNRNKHVNKGKQDCKSSNRRETVPLRCRDGPQKYTAGRSSLCTTLTNLTC